MNLTTCWDLLDAAASGHDGSSEEFCSRYRALIESFLSRRWSQGRDSQDVSDAAQEVLLECVREGGVLARAADARGSGFRAFLYGVTMNVARRFEERRAHGRAREEALPPESQHLADPKRTPEREFDRAWAIDTVRRARRAFEIETDALGGDWPRRRELLELRFFEELPIREIAARWNRDPARVHKDYAAARHRFRDVLRRTVLFDHPDEGIEVESELRALLVDLA